MANLVDKLITKVDRIRQRVNVDKVGVRRYHLFRVIRSWDGGEVGDGTPTIVSTEITPSPAIAFGGRNDRLEGNGRVDESTMIATEVSLTYQEMWLQGYPLSAGQECYYRLTERNAQGAQTTYWVLSTTPVADRCEERDGNIQWVLKFIRYEVTE